jgi:hypothetical protein
VVEVGGEEMLMVRGPDGNVFFLDAEQAADLEEERRRKAAATGARAEAAATAAAAKAGGGVMGQQQQQQGKEEQQQLQGKEQLLWVTERGAEEQMQQEQTTGGLLTVKAAEQLHQQQQQQEEEECFLVQDEWGGDGMAQRCSASYEKVMEGTTAGVAGHDLATAAARGARDVRTHCIAQPASRRSGVGRSCMCSIGGRRDVPLDRLSSWRSRSSSMYTNLAQPLQRRSNVLARNGRRGGCATRQRGGFTARLIL